MTRIPLMIYSDAITSPTGLGRIARELAVRINADLSETFELATMGYGGNTSREFPWPQYCITKLNNWAVGDLPVVWKDFAGDRRGVLLSILNPSWLPWLADWKKLPAGDLRNMLESNPFERWIYAPIDAEGPNGLLSSDVVETLNGFDRVLAYTEWAANMIDRSQQHDSVIGTQFLPHGVDTKVFYPRDRAEARATFLERVTGNKGIPGMKEDVLLIGICATNSARKDWGMAFEAAQELLKHRQNVGLWLHTNAMQKHWNLTELAKGYGLEGRIIPSHRVLSDEDMAYCYSACTVTWGIGSEGWGLPAAESLACGVPVITGAYAGSAEFVPTEYQVKPTAFYHDGFYGNKRPVFKAHDWATVTLRAAYQKAVLPEYIKWENCWKEWERWLLEGING